MKKLFWALSLMTTISLSNCGKNISSEQSISSNPEIQNNPDFSSSDTRGGVVLPGNNLTRECTNELLNANASGLAQFLDSPVENIEGPVTYCLEVKGTGDDAIVKFRLEWEDDEGLKKYPDYYADQSSNNDKMQLLYIDRGPFITEIILMDTEGFISIKGFASKSSSMFIGGLNFVDIVPFKRDINGMPILNSNDQPIYEASAPGPWDECKNENYVDGVSNHLSGHFNDGGIIKPCVTSFNIPRSIWDFDFNYVPSGEFTPTAITASQNGLSALQSANLVGMARQMLHVSNGAQLRTLNVFQNHMGYLRNPL